MNGQSFDHLARFTSTTAPPTGSHLGVPRPYWQNGVSGIAEQSAGSFLPEGCCETWSVPGTSCRLLLKVTHGPDVYTGAQVLPSFQASNSSMNQARMPSTNFQAGAHISGYPGYPIHCTPRLYSLSLLTRYDDHRCSARDTRSQLRRAVR
jgi:hypothetical protein